MRWTKAWFAAAVTASTLACFKSAAKKAAEVRECSGITMNAQGAAQDAGGVVSPALLQVEPRTGARRGRFDPSGADEEVVGHRVLIAAELERLLEPGQLAGLDVTWLPTEQPTPWGDYVALVPLLSRWVGGSDLKRLPKLKIVANCAVGHDNVDVVAAEMRRVTVTNTPDVLTDATADLAWALILACARHVVPGTQLVKSGSWTGWHPELLLGIELRGRTLGLFGAGRIGQAVGRRAVPFGMRILYTARNPRPDFERECGAVRVEFSRLLKESDVLSRHVPSVPDTES